MIDTLMTNYIGSKAIGKLVNLIGQDGVDDIIPSETIISSVRVSITQTLPEKNISRIEIFSDSQLLAELQPE